MSIEMIQPPVGDFVTLHQGDRLYYAEVQGHSGKLTRVRTNSGERRVFNYPVAVFPAGTDPGDAPEGDGFATYDPNASGNTLGTRPGFAPSPAYDWLELMRRGY